MNGEGSARRIGSFAEDEELKREPRRAYCLAGEMGEVTADGNPQGYYWRLAAYAYEWRCTRLERQNRWLRGALVVGLGAIVAFVIWDQL